MAKTIKFNLICDDEPIRNIEKLQEHFSIEDLLKYHKEGLLARWLDVRGYKDKQEQVAGLDKELDEFSKAAELVKIFGMESDESKIKEAVYNLSYEKHKKNELKQYETLNFQKSFHKTYMTYLWLDWCPI